MPAVTSRRVVAQEPSRRRARSRATSRSSSAACPRRTTGEMLCRTIYLSLDPYMRGRISGVKSYAKGVDPGDLMVGGTVSEVLESKHPGLQDRRSRAGVRRLAEPRRVVRHRRAEARSALAPVSTALGVLGMPGHDRLRRPARHRPAEAGRDGRGLRGVGRGGRRRRPDREAQGLPRDRHRGRARTSATTSWSELGFDACVNYKTDDLGRGAVGRLPEGHRRLLRERGRRRHRGGAAAAQSVRARAAVRADLDVQRHQPRPGSRAGAGCSRTGCS